METELEAMVVRLNGDGTSYVNMLDQAKAETKKATDTIADMGAAVLTALSAFGATSFLSNAFNMFKEQESVQLKLKAAIGANGGEVEATMQKYQAFATEIRKVTGVSNDETLSLLKKAEAHGLTGNAAMSAVQAAQRLAAGADVDAEAAIRMTVAMEQGNTRLAMSMARMVPSLRGIKDEATFVSRANQLMNIGVSQQTALMNSAAGVMKQYEGAVKALTKQFGSLVAEAFVPYYRWVTGIIRQFTDLDMGSKRVIVSSALMASSVLAIGPALSTISKYGQPVFTLLTSSFGLLGSVFSFILSPMKMLGAVFTGLGVVFSPIGIGIAAVAAVIGVLAIRAGGFKQLWENVRDWALSAWARVRSRAMAAWDYIQTKVSAFVTWAMPYLRDFAEIVSAYWGIVTAFWGEVADIAIVAWDFINAAVKNAWDYWTKVAAGMLGQTTITWNDIKNFIVSALLAVEFVIRNFGATFNLAWVTVALTGMRAIDTLRNGLLEWDIFTAGIWAGVAGGFSASMNNILFIADSAMLGLKAHWAGFRAAANAALRGEDVSAAFDNASNAVLRAHTEEQAAARARGESVRSYQDVGQAASAAFTRGEAAARDIHTSLGLLGDSDVTTGLQKEFNRLGDTLGEGWTNFRERRLRELAAAGTSSAPLPTAAASLGQTVGSNINKGMAKETHKFDATLTGSTEAMGRIASYLDRLHESGANANTIPTVLGQPRLPMVDVPNHSLYPIYSMPAVDVAMNLVPPSRVNLAEHADVLGALLGDDAEDTTDNWMAMLGTVGSLSEVVNRAADTPVLDFDPGAIGIAGMFQQVIAAATPNTVFTIPTGGYLAELERQMELPENQLGRNLTGHDDVLGALLGDDGGSDNAAMVAAVATTQVGAVHQEERDRNERSVSLLARMVEYLATMAEQEDPLQIAAAQFGEE